MPCAPGGVRRPGEGDAPAPHPRPVVVAGRIRFRAGARRRRRGWHARRMGSDRSPLVVADVDASRRRLEEHHAQSSGVWLVLSKRGMTGPTRLTYDEALEEALRYGWIDGQLRRGDDTTYTRRFTPRRAGSAWSKRNVAIVERMIGERRMHPAGLAEVERAKADGRWARAYAGSKGIAVPADFAAALRADPRAQAMFEQLDSRNRYAFLYRIERAKRAETMSRRTGQFVEMLARGETPPSPRWHALALTRARVRPADRARTGDVPRRVAPRPRTRRRRHTCGPCRHGSRCRYRRRCSACSPPSSAGC